MWRAIDLVLRFIYVVAAPLMLAPLAIVFPITGTLVGAGLATIVALIGSDHWHARVDRIPVLGRILGGMGRLGDFYREHPPKPLVYYIFYPLLLPVILFMRVPRREFLLYRKINVIALAVVVIGGAVDYVRNWRPELTLKLFLMSVIMSLILQLLATFALAMPIVTTLIALRLRGLTKTLALLVVLATLSAGAGVLAARKMHGAMQISTWMRLQLRTNAGRVEAHRCQQEHEPGYRGCTRENHSFVALVQALDQVYVTLRDHPGDTDAALEHARDKISDYYKPDETAAWQLYADEGVYILYVRYGKRPALWIGRDKRQLIFDPDKLPPGAVKKLGLPPPTIPSPAQLTTPSPTTPSPAPAPPSPTPSPTPK